MAKISGAKYPDSLGFAVLGFKVEARGLGLRTGVPLCELHSEHLVSPVINPWVRVSGFRV